MDPGVTLLPSAPKSKMSNDQYYPYRPDMDLYYLTGIAEENVIGALVKTENSTRFILFLREKDPKAETWSGKMLGHRKAIEQFGADEVFPYSNRKEQLTDLLDGHKRVYAPLARYDWFDDLFTSRINTLRAGTRSGKQFPTRWIDLSTIVHPLRQQKSSTEIELHQNAIDITWKGLKNVFQQCQPGINERELEAELHRSYRKAGATSQHYHAFPPIVASGNNTTILHYTDNDSSIEEDDFVLIDTGATWNYYSGDVTRTIPANGTFSTTQSTFYEAVLDCQKQILDLVKPGVRYDTLQHKTEEILARKMIDLNLLDGPQSRVMKQPEEEGENAPFKQFFMHKIGHWMGLDVHDVGPYTNTSTRDQDDWIELQPGMLITIEPGLYVPQSMEDVPDQWRGLGVRIEDDVLVTENGCDVLTDMIPKEIDELEAII